MNKLKEEEEKLERDEIEVADIVADEILIKEKEEKKMILFFLLLFILLVFVLSYLIFSRFAIFSKNTENVIQAGSIVFSYEEGTNKINIQDADAVKDEVGKQLSGSDSAFEFNVAVKIDSKIQPKLTYEISLTQKEGTLDAKYVRVMLLENGEEVLINGNTVNYYSDLKQSSLRSDAKLLYKKEISSEITARYVFKMWVGENYKLDTVKRTFSCFVNIDAY